MKVYQHILFWLVTIVVLTLFFGRSFDSITQSFFFVSMLLPVVVGTCYFFNYFLVPKYLLTKRKGKFILYSIYMIVISLYLEMLVITVSFILLANYQHGNMGYLSSDVIVLAVTLYLVVLVFSFILLVKKNVAHAINIQSLVEEKEKQSVGYITVRSNRKNTKIAYRDIQYVESLADYVTIHLNSEKSIITKEKISVLANQLPDNFIRIHRSYLVNFDQIQSFNKEELVINTTTLPISRTYKKETLVRLEK